ncbi:MAG: DUF3368 domain-containing protein [Fimbriimonadales bacterium]|nr:DUF3368 domain-containing protein [Fimbriimonadales bacterium]
MIHLAKINRLHLLKEFYQQILIPDAVAQEVVEQGAEYPETPIVLQAIHEGWITQAQVHNTPILRLLRHQLNAGEAEAIALAIQKQADIVLLDETEARSVAAQIGLSYTGTIGVLIRAKYSGLISQLKPELDNLRLQGGFWISDRLYHQILNSVGEEV